MRVGITGHRGLPDEVAVLVKEAIRDVVAGYPASDLVGVSCLADGPDAWFPARQATASEDRPAFMLNDAVGNALFSQGVGASRARQQGRRRAG